MILDPDEPIPQARTERQSLIKTERGWAVIGQATANAEAWLAEARDEMAELFPNQPEGSRMIAASHLAAEMVDRGAL